MRRYFFYIASLFVLMSCGENLNYDATIASECNKTRALSTKDFSFDSITKPEVWKTFQSLEEMRKACQIPADILPSLSTDELVRLCIEYPLFGNYSAYNDELVGIKKVMDGFNGFSELQKRTDAAEKLLDAYEEFGTPGTSDDRENTVTYPTLKLGYLELILYSGKIESLYQGPELQRMESIQKQKEVELRSAYSLSHNKLLANKIQKVKDSARTQYVTEFTVYTKYGNPVSALKISEMTADEISEMNAYATTTFPNAVFLSNASSTYNCHSYAWNMSDGGETCWINAANKLTYDNLMKYWTNDYYSETNTESKAVKIFYIKSDHSAIVSSVSGMYESKWGRLPLMRHAPNYGPYENMATRVYYTKRGVISGRIYCPGSSCGKTTTNKENTYSAKNLPTGNNIIYEWTITDGKEEDAIESRKATLFVNDYNVAFITFKEIGLYTICCDAYIKNSYERVGHAEYQEPLEN